MDRNKQGTDKQQGQRKPQQDPRRPGLDQPDPQRHQGDRTHPSSRPEQPGKGREGGTDRDQERRPMEREGDERSDRDAGAGRPVQLDDEDDEETTARA
jgi:hypothetical protein